MASGDSTATLRLTDSGPTHTGVTKTRLEKRAGGLRNKAKSGLIPSHEKWCVESLKVAAALLDLTFPQAKGDYAAVLGQLLSTEEQRPLREQGLLATNQIGLFIPNGVKESYYIDTVARPIRASAVASDLPVHPHVLAAVFADKPRGRGTRVLDLLNLVSSSGFDANGVTLALSLMLAQRCNAIQRDRTLPSLGGRGTGPTAQRIPDPQKLWRYYLHSSKEKFGVRGIRVPQRIGLIECWGYADALASTIERLTNIVFPRDAPQRRSLLSTLVAMDETCVTYQTEVTRKFRIRPDRAGEHILSLRAKALQSLADGKTTETTDAIVAIAFLNPKVFPPTAHQKFRKELNRLEGRLHLLPKEVHTAMAGLAPEETSHEQAAPILGKIPEARVSEALFEF